MINPLENTDHINQVLPHIIESQLDQDLQELKEKALAEGAADTAIITATDIIFDPDILQSVISDLNEIFFNWRGGINIKRGLAPPLAASHPFLLKGVDGGETKDIYSHPTALVASAGLAENTPPYPFT